MASGPANFRHYVDAMTAGLSGVACFIDDIIVTGANEREHLHNLNQLFERLCDNIFTATIFTVRYRPTDQHGNAARLSRLPMGPDSTFEKFKTRENAETVHVLSKTLDGFPLTHEDIRESAEKMSIVIL